MSHIHAFDQSHPLPTVPIVPSHSGLGISDELPADDAFDVAQRRPWTPTSISASVTNQLARPYPNHSCCTSTAHTSSAKLARPTPIYIPTHRHRASRRSLQPRAYQEKSPAEEHRLDLEARELMRQFLSCEGYYKYRTGKRKSKNSSSTVWPDNVEWAFFQAVVRYRPVGRDQVRNSILKDGKPIGRNELLSDYLLHETGVSRRRKQISSHLQVLRQYAVHRPDLLGYMISQMELPGWNKKQIQKGKPTGTISNANMSVYEPTNDFNLKEVGELMSHGDQKLSCQFSFCDFDMSLRVKDPVTHEIGSLVHTYTRSNLDSRLPDIAFEGGSRSFETFPELFTNQLARPVGNLLIAIEASIQLPLDIKPTVAPKELVICFDISGPKVGRDAVVDTITTIYENCTPVNSIHQFGSLAEDGVQPKIEDQAIYHMNFFSSFWVHLLSDLGFHGPKQRRSGQDPSLGVEEQRHRVLNQSALQRQRTSQKLRSFTAVQQVSIYSASKPDAKHNITLRWQFKPASLNAPGHTSWCLVQLPMSIELGLPSPTDTDPKTGNSFSASLTSSANDGAESGSEPPTPELCMDKHPPHLQSPISFPGESSLFVGDHNSAGVWDDEAMYSAQHVTDLGYDTFHIDEASFPTTDATQAFEAMPTPYGQHIDTPATHYSMVGLEDHTATQGASFASHGQIQMDPNLMVQESDWCIVSKEGNMEGPSENPGAEAYFESMEQAQHGEAWSTLREN